MADTSIITAPALSGTTGISNSLPQMATQGQTSTASGVNYPTNNILSLNAIQQQLNSIAGNNAAPSQVNPANATQFRQLTEAQIQQMLSQGQANLILNQANSIYGINREPWVFAVFEDIVGQTGSAGITNANQFIQVTNTQNALIWVANPRSVTWQINQRGTEVKNKSGTVLHMWRDRTRKSDYDDPKITIQFQSGNIMPNTGDATSAKNNSSAQNYQIAGGLNNFYQYLGLVDRQKLTQNGAANLVHIMYRSRMFPSLILTGFFDPQGVVQFSDDSQSPFQITGWQAVFTIYSTIPKINNPNLLASIFQTDGLSGFNSNTSSSSAGAGTVTDFSSLGTIKG